MKRSINTYTQYQFWVTPYVKVPMTETAFNICKKALNDFKIDPSIDIDTVVRRDRRAEVVTARTICCYALRVKGYSLPAIARELNLHNHTAALYLLKKFKYRVVSNDNRKVVNQIMKLEHEKRLIQQKISALKQLIKK